MPIKGPTLYNAKSVGYLYLLLRRIDVTYVCTPTCPSIPGTIRPPLFPAPKQWRNAALTTFPRQRRGGQRHSQSGGQGHLCIAASKLIYFSSPAPPFALPP